MVAFNPSTQGVKHAARVPHAAPLPVICGPGILSKTRNNIYQNNSYPRLTCYWDTS